MTADEALAIVETLLDYKSLNHVQEIVFRQSWEGRSYQQISRTSGYDYSYLKDTGSKLWKQLGKAFGEKVTKDNLKSVLRRYLRRNQVSFERNQVIEIHLNNGSGINVANISEARLLFANLNEFHCDRADFDKEKRPDDRTILGEDEINGEEESHPIAHEYSSENITYYWNGLYFRSLAEVKIAEALDRAEVLFFPKATARLQTPDGKQNEEPHFLVYYEGKSGILKVDVPQETESDRDRVLQSQGIQLVRYYDPIQCRAEPDTVVREFLQLLR